MIRYEQNEQFSFPNNLKARQGKLLLVYFSACAHLFVFVCHRVFVAAYNGAIQPAMRDTEISPEKCFFDESALLKGNIDFCFSQFSQNDSIIFFSVFMLHLSHFLPVVSINSHFSAFQCFLF